jgi:hypothetical protein
VEGIHRAERRFSAPRSHETSGREAFDLGDHTRGPVVKGCQVTNIGFDRVASLGNDGVVRPNHLRGELQVTRARTGDIPGGQVGKPSQHCQRLRPGVTGAFKVEAGLRTGERGILGEGQPGEGLAPLGQFSHQRLVSRTDRLQSLGQVRPLLFPTLGELHSGLTRLLVGRDGFDKRGDYPADIVPDHVVSRLPVIFMCLSGGKAVLVNGTVDFGHGSGLPVNMTLDFHCASGIHGHRLGELGGLALGF